MKLRNAGICLLAVVTLGGCDEILTALYDLVRSENVGQPRFLYALEDVADPAVHLALISAADEGFTLPRLPLGIASGEISFGDFSPGAIYAAGDFIEFVSDIDDFGVWILNVELEVLELIASDNIVGSEITAQCDMSQFVGEDVIDALFPPDHFVSVTVDLERAEPYPHVATVLGWVDADSLLVRHTGEWDANFTADGAASFFAGIPGELSFDIRYDRNAAGVWEANVACDGLVDPVLPQQPSSRVMEISDPGGDILLDGTVLPQLNNPANPMQPAPARAILAPVQ